MKAFYGDMPADFPAWRDEQAVYSRMVDNAAIWYIPSFLDVDRLAFVQSQFEKKDQNMVLIPVPVMKDGNVYPAVVEAYRGVFSQSENSNAAYELIRSLMDADLSRENSSSYGFSVSRAVNQADLAAYDGKAFVNTLDMMLNNIEPPLLAAATSWKTL